MVTSEKLDGGGVRYTSPKGSVEITWIAPRVLLSRFRGRAEVALYDPYNAELLRAAEKAPKFEHFVDAEALDSYDAELRVKWIGWFRRNSYLFGDFHILQRSTFVAVGIQIANLALEGMVIKSYTNRAKFESVLDAAVRREGGPTRP
jgi:hypothetical protein